MLPVGDAEFSGHASQAAEPACALYVPSTHSTHAPPSAPVAPTSQVHCVRNAEACDEFECGGQGSQVALPLADHVPAGHSWQVSTPVAPTAAEYSPPAHAEHTYLSRLS